MPDYKQLVDQLLDTVQLTEVSPDVFRGESYDYVGTVSYTHLRAHET